MLTIVAASAKSVNDGFLCNRTVFQPRTIVPTILPADKFSVAQLVSFNHTKPNDPIETRAWTYQERVLSRRALSFEKFELTWACQHHSKSTQNWISAYNLGHNSLSASPIAEKWKAWMRLVTDYSRRQSTFPQGKLVAFSAIATCFGQYCGFSPDEYWAGLWKKLIIPCLLWFVGPSNSITRQCSPEYIAPSWSWASVSTAAYPHLASPALQDDLILGEAIIQRVTITPKSAGAPFSAVQNATLAVKGLTTAAILNMSEQKIHEVCHPSILSASTIRLYPDRPNFGVSKENQAVEINVRCLELSRSQRSVESYDVRSICIVIKRPYRLRYGLLLCSNGRS